MNKDNPLHFIFPYNYFTQLQDSVMHKKGKDRITPLDIITEEMFSNKTMSVNHTINSPALFRLAKTSSRKGFKTKQKELRERLRGLETTSRWFPTVK